VNRSVAPTLTPWEELEKKHNKAGSGSVSKKDLSSKAFLRKETEPTLPGLELELDRRPAASQYRDRDGWHTVERLYNFGYGYSRRWKGNNVTVYCTCGKSRAMAWLEHPFFGANKRMPMILRQESNWVCLDRRPRHYFKGFPVCHTCVANIPGLSDLDIDTLFAGISRSLPH